MPRVVENQTKQLPLYEISGKSLKKIKIADLFWHIKPNPALIHQVVTAQLANERQSNAHTKTRAQVAGGGRKPWRQKGTGRARAGSIRSPLWRGGGITFGPLTKNNYHKRLTKKMRQQALLIAINDKLVNQKIIIVKEITIEAPKTRHMVALLNNLPSKDGSVLLILPKFEPAIEVAAANLPYLKVVRANSLNPYDVLNHDYLLTTQEGFKAIEAQLALPASSKAKAKEK